MNNPKQSIVESSKQMTVEVIEGVRYYDAEEVDAEIERGNRAATINFDRWQATLFELGLKGREIERLRAENAELIVNNDAGSMANTQLNRTVERLTRELEESRAANWRLLGTLGAPAPVEIERLRGLLADAIGAEDNTDKENQRLRAALERIARKGNGYTLEPGAPAMHHVAMEMVRIAREALQKNLYSVQPNNLERVADETPAAPVWEIPSGWRGQPPWFRAGDKVKPVTQICGLHPVCTITEITERGFKYTHERISMGPRYGWIEGGETYEPSGYERASVETSETMRLAKEASERVADAVPGNPIADWKLGEDSK
jgi:hypothetical protein